MKPKGFWINNPLEKRFKSTCLHWICCIFLILYIWMNQYNYAKGDRLFVVDHDLQFSDSLFMKYNQNPVGYIASSLKDLIYRKDCYPSGATFLNLRLATEFYLFGRTPFVYKMDMAYALIIMCLAIYFIVHTLTKRELFGFVSSIMLLHFPVIIDSSRKQFVFILVAAICTVALCIAIRNMELNKKLGCVLFSLCLLLGSFIHPSSFLYLAFIYFYLACSKKNRLHYVLMVVFFLLVFAWSYPQFLSWVKNKYDHPGLSSSLFELLINSTKRIGIRQYEVFLANTNPLLILTFIINAFFLLFLYALNRLIFKTNVPKIEPGQKLIFFYLGYIILLFLVTQNTHIANYIPLFVLYIIACFVLLSLIENALPRWRIFAQFYVVLCLLFFIFYTIKESAYRQEPRLTIPITVGKSSPYNDMTYRLPISEDMADITQLFVLLSNENKRKYGTSDLHILSSAVTLYYDGDKISIGRAYPFYTFESATFDDTHWLYAPQAFYSGVQVQWRYLLMYFRQEEFDVFPSGTFNNNFDTTRAKEWYTAQMGEEISDYKYMFLTVLTQSNNPTQTWQMPSINLVLDRIKEANSPMYNKFYSNITLLTKLRVHKNFFLFIFRIGD